MEGTAPNQISRVEIPPANLDRSPNIDDMEAESLQWQTNRAPVASEVAGLQKRFVRTFVPVRHNHDGLGVIASTLMLDRISIRSPQVMSREKLVAADGIPLIDRSKDRFTRDLSRQRRSRFDHPKAQSAEHLGNSSIPTGEVSCDGHRLIWILQAQSDTCDRLRVIEPSVNLQEI